MVFKRVGRVFGPMLPRLGRTLLKLGIAQEPDYWLGKRFVITALVGLVTSGLFYLLTLSRTYASIGFVAGVILFAFIQYVILYLRGIERTRKVEYVLPEFLLAIASNLRAGMTPYSAFIRANRPEFGDLYVEIQNTASQVSAKTSLESVLVTLEERFDSELFRRSIDLFSKASKSGGQLAKLLIANADEMRRVGELRKELVTQTRSYSIFLAFIVIIVMPFLLAVSVQFLRLFESIQSSVGGGVDLSSVSSSVPLFAGKLPVTVGDMQNAATISLIVTTLLSSMLNGVISQGKALYGIKYYPLIVVAALLAFSVAQQLVASIVKL